MGLETILRVLIGTALFSVFGYYINSLLYYVFYIIKVVYSGFYLVFSVLGTSSFVLALLYYVMVYFVIGFLILFLLKLIK